MHALLFCLVMATDAGAAAGDASIDALVVNVPSTSSSAAGSSSAPAVAVDAGKVELKVPEDKEVPGLLQKAVDAAKANMWADFAVIFALIVLWAAKKWSSIQSKKEVPKPVDQVPPVEPKK